MVSSPPSFSVLLALPFSKRKPLDPQVTSDPQRSASTEFPDVRVQSHCTESQVSCISVWRQATALLRTYHPDPTTYLLFSLQARYQCCLSERGSAEWTKDGRLVASQKNWLIIVGSMNVWIFGARWFVRSVPFVAFLAMINSSFAFSGWNSKSFEYFIFAPWKYV